MASMEIVQWFITSPIFRLQNGQKRSRMLNSLMALHAHIAPGIVDLIYALQFYLWSSTKGRWPFADQRDMWSKNANPTSTPTPPHKKWKNLHSWSRVLCTFVLGGMMRMLMHTGTYVRYFCRSIIIVRRCSHWRLF